MVTALVDVVLEQSLEDLARLEQGFDALPPADPAREDRAWLHGVLLDIAGGSDRLTIESRR